MSRIMSEEFQRKLKNDCSRLMILNDIYHLHSFQCDVNSVPNDMSIYTVPVLHQAVFDGNISLVKRLVNEEKTQNEGIFNGPRYLKCRKDNVTHVVGFFKGATPLMVACHTGNTKLVSLLIEKGAIVNTSDSLGLTPLAYACAMNHLHICKILRRNGCLVEIRDDKFGMTPLHIACRMGHTHLVKWLVSNGANINACDYNGRSSLHFAAWTYNVQLIEYLVSKRVQLNIRDKNGNTPLHYIVSNIDLLDNNITRYFCPYEYNTAASVIGQIESIKEYSLNVDIHREEDREIQGAKPTDVWYATSLLVKLGADPNFVNYAGETPLHSLAKSLPETLLFQGYAVVFQNKVNQEMLVQMLILLKLGADCELLTKSGKSATDICYGQENLLAVKLLNKYTNLSQDVVIKQPDLFQEFIQQNGMKYVQKEICLEKNIEQISDHVIEPPKRRSCLEICRRIMHSVYTYIDEVIIG